MTFGIIASSLHRVLYRFPAALLGCLTFTALCVSDTLRNALLFSGPVYDSERFISFFAALAIATLVSVLLRLRYEDHPNPLIAEGLPFMAVCFCLTPLFITQIFPCLFIGLGAVCLGIMGVFSPLAPWLRALTRGLLFSLLLTLGFCIGVSLLLASVDALFDVHIPSKLFQNLSAIGGFFLFPVGVLSLLPTRKNLQHVSPYSRWMVSLVDWMIIPLSCAFGVLFNIYCLFLIITHAMPRGILSGMVIAYVIIGGIFWLQTTAFDGAAGAPSRFFRRWFFPSLAAPSVAMGLAALERVQQYGLTEPRYLLLLAAMGLMPLTLWAIVRPLPPRRILIGTGIALALTTVGPWGATGLSVSYQTNTLIRIVTHIIKTPDTVTDEDRKLAQGAAAFLKEHHALYSRPLIDLTKTAGKDLDALLAITETESPRRFVIRAYASDNHNEVISLQDYNLLITHSLDFSTTENLPFEKTLTYDTQRIVLRLTPSPATLWINPETPSALSFPLEEIIKTQLKEHDPLFPHLDAKAPDGSKGRLLLKYLGGTHQQTNNIHLDSAAFTLLLSTPSAP